MRCKRSVRGRGRFSQRENKWSKEHDQFDTSRTRESQTVKEREREIYRERESEKHIVLRIVNDFSKRPSTSAGWKREKKQQQRPTTTTKCCRRRRFI